MALPPRLKIIIKKNRPGTKESLNVKKKSKEWQESWDKGKDVRGEFLRMNNNGNYLKRELAQLSLIKL